MDVLPAQRARGEQVYRGGTPSRVRMTAVDVDARVAWANKTRLAVTRPDALHDDGSINQMFFKPKKVVFEEAGKKWGNDERDKMYKGLEIYGAHAPRRPRLFLVLFAVFDAPTHVHLISC